MKSPILGPYFESSQHDDCTGVCRPLWRPGHDSELHPGRSEPGGLHPGRQEVSALESGGLHQGEWPAVCEGHNLGRVCRRQTLNWGGG
ncbi:unnamed protein product [Staurois parvus]|uniref:Uncharacterized protein n=1 Tax=Staurois parvus TaxID=386267 RepID=A0ABN9FG52_9NEOB|nr:unnamed protein product [Staurois parvus]